LNFSGLSSAQTGAHIHGAAAPGVSAPILFPLPNGILTDFLIAVTPGDVSNLKNDLLYINVHSSNFPNGKIRGQFQSPTSGSSVQFTTSSFGARQGGGGATTPVPRLGDTSGAATADYSTSDGTADQRTDYTSASGTLKFAAGEKQKTFTVPLVDDGYIES